MKILTILGARPQFIKAASLSRILKNYPQIQEIIIHTGQHFDPQMSDIFFSQLHIPKPTYSLQIKNKSHATMTGEMMEEIEKISQDIKPDATLVYGDTNSTLAGALSSAKLHIPIIHIEAGLRSFNLKMPEEINRILTDRISWLLFCPSQKAFDNLMDEGFSNFPCKIYKSGDIMLDSLLYYSPYAKKPPIPIQKDFALATIHRPCNTDDPQTIHTLIAALDTLASTTQIILPLHPRTAKTLSNLHIVPKHITLTNPLGYLEMIWLLKHSKAVLTDSGGLQKEAYFFGKPCLILREESEWEELVTHQCGILVGTHKEKIIQSFGNIPYLFAKPFPKNLYGQGQSGEFIAKKILEMI
ncbi:UDP-N-acetylglucosamine 2-epimerase (non-hydrolyzing) [Helicobacter sp. 11S03491-1]|uniref:non-hydrolyzing UDP-N-acetylglucosamine 2-epimerase n=1 Tax=Helicobacter sp. 11S03491-1 TaxID=1476196 RepID=UPI000BA53C9B|nr:UDP-N-acetylglucosamine 2-epimerase (non-hydrolyzing) [Helicobacter sp. 11S03491-1]PAF43797.1 UDP-N-acetylglucosamine 2-epimerase [Helicobacter sp. 11S03491-1]